MESSDLYRIKHKTVNGYISSITAQALVKFIGIVVGIFLARLLTPEIFGIYAIATFAIGIIAIAGDCGTTGALIRQENPPTKEELAGTFTFQVGIFLFLTILIFLFCPFLGDIYELSDSQIWITRTMGIIFFLNSLQAIPRVMLSRNLEFGKIAKIDGISVSLLHVSSLIAALWGFGVWSFVIGAFIGTLSTLLLLYIVNPWMPQLNFKMRSIVPKLAFGLKLQTIGLISIVRESFGSFIVGIVRNPSDVGYLNWAMTYTCLPNFFGESIKRVNFSSFSRLQNNKDELTKMIKQTLRIIFLIGVPLTVTLVSLSLPIIEWVYSAKWIPAMPAVAIFIVYALARLLIDPIFTFFSVVGMEGVVIKVSLGWLTLTAAFASYFVYSYGFIGMAIAHSLASAIIAGVSMLIISSFFSINILYIIGGPILAGLLMWEIIIIAEPLFVGAFSVWLFVGIGGVGWITYLATVYFLDKKQLGPEIRLFTSFLQSKIK